MLRETCEDLVYIYSSFDQIWSIFRTSATYLHRYITCAPYLSWEEDSINDMHNQRDLMTTNDSYVCLDDNGTTGWLTFFPPIDDIVIQQRVFMTSAKMEEQ